MSFRFKNKLILAKIEGTYKQDPTPVEGTNAVLTSNLTVNPYEGDRVSRNIDKGALGADEEINVGAHVLVEFDVEIAGTYGTDDAPEYSALLTACAMEETVTVTTGPIYYDPESLASGFDSITIYFNHDGEQQIIVGCRGNVTLNFTKGQLPTFHFRFIGVYALPTAVSQYNPTITNWMTPLPVNFANTGTITIHGTSVVLESFTLDIGNNVVYRNLPGLESVEITDRQSKGSLLFEAPTLAAKDFYTAVESHSGTIVKAALAIVHGPAGNRFSIDVDEAQLMSINPQESDGVKMYAIDYSCIPSSAGDDEWRLTATGLD